MIPPQLGQHTTANAHFEAAFEARARRAVSAVNVRREDKAVFDALQAWWSVERGSTLSQWEAFTLLVALALGNPECVVPEEVRRLVR